MYCQEHMLPKSAELPKSANAKRRKAQTSVEPSAVCAVCAVWVLRRLCPAPFGPGASGALRGLCLRPYFLKSTFGASRFAALVTSKYSRGLAPMIFAVITTGNRRIYVLCRWTASL